jgi:hypothetical protein
MRTVPKAQARGANDQHRALFFAERSANVHKKAPVSRPSRSTGAQLTWYERQSVFAVFSNDHPTVCFDVIATPAEPANPS